VRVEEARETSGARAHAGDSGVACGPRSCCSSLSRPCCPGSFDSGEPPLDEVDRGQDVEHELEVLRLPVLHDRLAEGGGGDVALERDGLGFLSEKVSVGDLAGVEGALARHGLPGEREEEDREEEERQPVVAQRAHHRCARPTNV
jgi:hypothetical protein